MNRKNAIVCTVANYMRAVQHWAAFLFGGCMRELILNCARRIKKDTTMKRAFLKAVGVDVPTKESVIFVLDDSKDIRDCFKNTRRVNL